MKLAWDIRRAGQSFSDAIKRAWATLRLKAKMLTGEATFSYTKENGERREAVGTYQTEELTATGHIPPKTLLVIKYFDVIAKGWRSFRADRLILN